MFLKQQISSFFRFFGLYVPLNCPMCGGIPFDGSPNMFCKDCFEKLPFITKDDLRESYPYGLFAVDIGNPEATAVSLIEWIDERNEYEIENAYNVYSASTRRSAYEASRLVKFAKNTLEVLGNYSNLKDMDYLSARLYYGVKEDIIPLVVGVKRLGRKRARLLMKTFGDNLNEASEKDLQKIEGIGPKLAGKIKIFTMNH